MTGNTLFLDPEDWDLTLDLSGRIKMVDEDYAIAQNVANAVRAFTRDMCFNQQDGVPHFETDASLKPVDTLIRSRFNRAARAVPGVASVDTTITRFDSRVLEGDIRITTTNGRTLSIAI